MMDNDWKSRLGVVFSTNPDFQYVTSGAETAPETLPPARQKLIVSIDRRNRGGKQVTLVTGFTGTPEDLKALEMALRVKDRMQDATVTVVTMGPSRAKSINE